MTFGDKMYKVYVFILILFSFLLIPNKVAAYQILHLDNYTYIEDNNTIYIYYENEMIDSINGSFLDIKDTQLLYNMNNSIYLYDISNGNNIKVIEHGYNALFYKNNIVFESDYNDEFICKHIIEQIHLRNCYKLYVYELDSKSISLIDLIGEDNYLNDVYGDFIAYNSIHTIDEYCDSICSYVNIYNMDLMFNRIINEYDSLNLDMSGNAIMDNNLLYFESVPKIYGCDYTQIFIYDIDEYSLEMLTKNNGGCFTDSLEIVNADDNYLLFKSKHSNYIDSRMKNYIYSYDDSKYSFVDNICQDINSYLYDTEIFCFKENKVNNILIDNIKPILNNKKMYTIHRENKSKFLELLEYEDNLSSKNNIKLEVLSSLSNLGEQYIDLVICDKFNNCLRDSIFAEIIDIDITPPKIYYQEKIIIKANETLNINDFGYAIDNVDGKIRLYLLTDIDYNARNSQSIVVFAEDSSGNKSYKEISLKIYDGLTLNKLYYLIIYMFIIVVAIIYILRFKNKKKF